MSLPIRVISLNDLFQDLAQCRSIEGLASAHPALASQEASLSYVSLAFKGAADYCHRHGVAIPEDLQERAIIPNQFGQFRGAADLWIDGGIDETLKNISKELGIPFRARLVHPGVTQDAAGRLVSRLCGGRVFRAESAVPELVNTIEKRAAEALRGEAGVQIKNAAVRFLVWAAEHPALVDIDLASYPLLCADGKLRSVSELHEIFIGPSPFLSEAERNWVSIFPESIRLSDQYISECRSLGVSGNKLANFLCDRGLASASLHIQREMEIDSDILSCLQSGGNVTAGHRIDRLRLSSVAGLTHLLSAVAGVSASGRPTEAGNVLTFVLTWLIQEDVTWKMPVETPCVAKAPHDCSGSLSLYPSEWLGRLKSTSWLPTVTSGGACEPMNAKSVDSLLGHIPEEVFRSVEAQSFLSLHCGVDRLDLAVRAIAGNDSQKRRSLRDEWAEVVAAVQPSEVEDFVQRRRHLTRINTRNNKLGRTVEGLIKQAFEAEGFTVKRTAVGSDFRVSMCIGKDPAIEVEEVGSLSLSLEFEARSVEFLVEVKATESDSVRMSWTQAETAGKDVAHYVLCVVDLSADPHLVSLLLEKEIPAEKIANCIKLVPDIGTRLVGAVDNLSAAVQVITPGIEVERTDDLRFKIGRAIWLGGPGLREWARSVRKQLLQ